MEFASIFNYGHYVVLAIFAALLASMFGAFMFFAMRGAKLPRAKEETDTIGQRFDAARSSGSRARN